MTDSKLFAVPTDRGETKNRKRSAHFGHSDQFTIIRLENREAVIAATIDNIAHGAGGCLAPISLLREQQIDGIIVGGMGKRPLAGFMDAGIDVYWAPLAEYPLVEDVVGAILKNRLQEMSGLHRTQLPSRLAGEEILKDKSCPFTEGLGHFSAGRGKKPLDGPPGDPHSLAGLLLGQPLVITESQDLQLISTELDLFQTEQRFAGGLKCLTAEFAVTAAMFPGPWRHGSGR